MEKMAKKFAKSFEQSVDPDKKQCHYCQLHLESNAKFCWKCGKKIS
jgi:predicted amidophosphoribosyltransferase